MRRRSLPADLNIAARFGHRAYLDMAHVGAGDNYIGAEQYGIWYTRNVKIYANLARIAKPGDRLLGAFVQRLAPQVADARTQKRVDRFPSLLGKDVQQRDLVERQANCQLPRAHRRRHDQRRITPESFFDRGQGPQVQRLSGQVAKSIILPLQVMTGSMSPFLIAVFISARVQPSMSAASAMVSRSL